MAKLKQPRPDLKPAVTAYGRGDPSEPTHLLQVKRGRLTGTHAFVRNSDGNEVHLGRGRFSGTGFGGKTLKAGFSRRIELQVEGARPDEGKEAVRRLRRTLKASGRK